MVRATPVLLFFLGAAVLLTAVRGDEDKDTEVFDPDLPPLVSDVDIDDLPPAPAEDESSPPPAKPSAPPPQTTPPEKPADAPPKPPESPQTRRTDMSRPSHLTVDLNFMCANNGRMPFDKPSTTGIPYVVPEDRLRRIRSEFLYCFFDQGYDADDDADYQKDIHSSMPQIHKNLNFQLPFFGFRYNYTRLSINGFLEFSDPPKNYRYPLSFPMKDWPRDNDPSFIGIFFSKMRVGQLENTDIDRRRPGVYFRLERDLQSRTDQFGVETRERLMWDIREGIIGADSFVPKHAVIVTWKNVSFAGGIDNSLYKTNTFQMVLATDEVFTYAIFNYAKMDWTTHTEAGGDTTNGEGGVPAYIGFNAGNGTQSYEYKPYSQSSAVRDLTGRGWGNGFPGRHIFRIDERIILGTCNKDIAGTNLPLVFAPESGNMLGGTLVNITGPCFLKTDKVRCRFDYVEVVGNVVNENRAVCIQPFIMAEGPIRFEISINNAAYNWKGKYFIETAATAEEKISFDNLAVHEKNPSEITFTWNSANLTANANAQLRVSLWGYRETSKNPELLFIDTIAENVQNNGRYTFAPQDFRSRDNRMVNDIQFGFIQINLTNPVQYSGSETTPYLWSRPIPLGWYFNAQWERLYGTDWPKQMCDQWIMNDRYLKNFAHEVAQCPCTLEQALADKGRYYPDYDCDKDLNPNCFYHQGALHCVRTGVPSMEGSEQQCCYDKNRLLMLTYDQKWGSRPHRSHNLGLLPWNEANKVPTLSHWFHDMAPYYQCCVWQDDQSVGCETFRFERRPTQDCIGYQAPGVATVFGDPHFVTFDGLEYTFNGKGEFVLLRSDSPKHNLNVQGRFEQVPHNRYGDVMATQLTAIAAQENSSTIIEVRLRPRAAQWRYRLDVLAGGQKVYFDRPALKYQHFQGVTVYTPTYLLNQSEVVIMFQSGAGVEVVENKGYMTARVYLPWSFINQTKGLFGNWSFDMIDDFALPDGSVVNPSTNINNFERVHKDFGIKYLLTNKYEKNVGKSLFNPEFDRISSFYANASFEPEYRTNLLDIVLPNRTQDRLDAERYCKDVYQCKYDYAMSLNRELAEFTSNYLNTHTQIQEITKENVISCGVLETPRFGRKSTFKFTPGTVVTYECNQDFVLVGDIRRTCGTDGKWSVPEQGYSECLRMQEYSSRTLATISGAILGVVVPLALIIALAWYCLVHKKSDVEETETSWDFRKARLSKEVPLRQHRTPVGSFMPSGAVGSDRSSSSGGGGITNGTKKGQGKKRRSYDGVYRTHEPLPGASSVDFGKKLWDLEEEGSGRGLNVSSSPPESEITSSEFSSTLSDRKGQGGVSTDIY